MTKDNNRQEGGAKDNNNKKQAGGSIMVDVMSPYFISAADSPNIVFVSGLLRDGNYADWVDDMTNALFAKNKIGFVDGSISIPDEGAAELPLWKRCNAMVKGWLLSSMEKEIRMSVKHAKTAREVWDDLQERFGSESAPRAYELKRALTLTRQEKLSISSYYTKLKGLWDEIQSIFPVPKCKCDGCTCDISKQLVEIREKERLYEFLMGLDESFGTIKTQILSTKPIVSLGTAYHLVSEDEKQKQIATTGRIKVEAAAFQAYGTNRQNREEAKGNQHEKPRCTHCGKFYHTVEHCYEIVGYPEGRKKDRDGDKGRDGRSKHKVSSKTAHLVASSPIPGLSVDQYTKLVEYFGGTSDTSNAEHVDTLPTANMAGKATSLNTWIIDSGASEHITFDGAILENQTRSGDEMAVKIPNGEPIPVMSVGNTSLPNELKIDNVLNIPAFKCNLLSVSKLTKALRCALIFFPDFCVIQDLASRNLIGMGRDAMSVAKEGMAMTVIVDSRVWHKRLGHAAVSKSRYFDNICGISINDEEHCDSCLRAKLTRLLFKEIAFKRKIVSNLFIVTFGVVIKHLLLVLIIFYLFRGVWFFLMKYKSEVNHYLTMFCNMVHTQFGKNVKRIRSDNGVEFQSRQMLDYYTENGILLETSCTDTPQQNGVVERKHRHILEVARALRFEAGLPIEFWGECILTAMYIINRLPTKVLKNKTPYEILFNKRPSYDHLRIFGCLVYVKDNKKGGDKFGVRGRPCVFVGYPHAQRGYRVFDLETRKTYTSRDVKFIENVFPFKDTNIEPRIPELVTQRANEWDEDFIGHKDGNPPVVVQDEASTQDHLQEHVPPQEDTLVEEEMAQNSSQSTVEPENENLRRSDRTKRQPKRLDSYVTEIPQSIDHSQPIANSGTSTVYPLSNFVSYNKFSSTHKACLAAITSHDEPKYYHQAVKNDQWREAMKQEIQALEESKTWTLEPLPPGKKAIDSKWVYKIKYKPNGEIERYKARLVAKGFTQVEGIDFHETFAPVAKLVTMRSLLAVSAKKNWAIHQLDVNNAFLHGDLVEDVYMKIPQGFAKSGETRVCKLRKSLYGLRQASRNWYHKFTRALLDIGFRQSRADHSLFIFKTSGIYVAALIYVDDVILAGNDERKIADVKAYLDGKFSIKDLGPFKYFLGIEVARSQEGIVLSQRKYTLDILEECGFQGS
ncbi:hypothetical protein OSB04_026830 [Centaurea solstitialis]|uniref:Integrase catalytic domain-containing protein n=1 Tax=Centaurea solstitialis TaxID=347529 RepID=A0AA38SE07_9ASTR|nr:hypothetical protein OSB04_026830 [Centaurea solstitialis]